MDMHVCLSFLCTQLLGDGLAAVAAVTHAPDICYKSNRFVFVECLTV